jgi:hypothetical protein
MPLTLNVGISRKLGQADFGSFGAHCNLTVELDPAVLQGDADALQRHVRHAYAACSRAVNEELARQMGGEVPAPTANSHAAAAGSVPAPATRTTGGNGQTATQDGNNGGNGSNGSNGHHGPSQKQIGYINQLARGIRGLGVRKLDQLTGRMYGKPLAGLSSLDASSLIDTLKAVKAGSVSLDAALGNGAAS